jgi:hypothetical protein
MILWRQMKTRAIGLTPQRRDDRDTMEKSANRGRPHHGLARRVFCAGPGWGLLPSDLVMLRYEDSLINMTYSNPSKQRYKMPLIQCFPNAMSHVLFEKMSKKLLWREE